MLTGLVVGKFAPLHKGHEALIAFAQAQCDRLVILSYSKPERPGCPPERRAAWLAALYPDALRLVLDDAALATFAARTGEAPRILPHNDAPDEAHRSFVAWVCRAMLGLTVDRVFTSEAYGDGFAASLARHFDHVVEHRMFDHPRERVPISATRLRAEPALGRSFLTSTIRRDLVRRVALIGGESTGKTTLAAALAQHLKTIWVPEYGRELWELRRGELRFDDLLTIAREQIAREDAALNNATGWLICDTSPLVTMFYSEAMFARVDPELRRLAERRYDETILCAADFPFVQDGTRQDDAFRARQNDWYRNRLDRVELSYLILQGPPLVRVETALRYLRSDRGERD
ncbi:AAA family ATPase [Sphingomonas psychrotolerans]|uniref:AAA family ATPase n=1 Tax=Sphingomonas psychrotolerans TaxID=1327635 RepID=A0ABU3N042_9SPHN|nr:AAA family ATPase [Sphingomonas psychrotolerans]MDT8757748.1 AAA family ATPase [Sphingomonas psychrotolerans]